MTSPTPPALVPIVPTQTKHPWRAVARTAVAALVAAAAIVPEVVSVSHLDTVPALSGVVGTLVAVSAGVTRVFALASVNGWLGKYLPFLAATPPTP